MHSIIRNIRKKVIPFVKNAGGWTTNRKIVVIESDDWGSIRMPSREVYEACLKAGYRVDQNPYERFDSLASEKDLEFLFETLESYRDFRGNHPVITANVLTANPDFERIKNSKFEKYFFESIKKTFDRYPKHGNCLNLWQEGREKNIFFPQSHGREHLNVSLFMNDLQKYDSDLHFSFDHQIPGTLPRLKEYSRNKYVIALDYIDEADKINKRDIIIQGLEQFEELFGYRSETFMAPNYYWCPDFDSSTIKRGVKFYQGNRKMIEPGVGKSFKVNKRKLGEINQVGQTYLIRNALFEPSLFRKNIADPVNSCLREISASFFMKKPAVISSHRLNFIGFIDVENRDNNLVQLNSLLGEIKKRWPDVEFMNSLELGNLISNK